MVEPLKTVRDERGNVHVFDCASYTSIIAAINGGEMRRSDFVAPPQPFPSEHERAGFSLAEPRETEGETP